MAEEQQNSGHSNGGIIIPTPEEVATFLPKTVAEGDSFFSSYYLLQLTESYVFNLVHVCKFYS